MKTAVKARQKRGLNQYQSLPRTARKELEEDRKGSITTVYDYIPLAAADFEDPLQRFGYVKVEGTSFTVSEPFITLTIEPVLYTYANEGQRIVLQEQFDIKPFEINTIRLERIFADKIFAAEFYYEREDYFDVAKHIYDVSIMLDLPQIQQLLRDKTILTQMIGYKRLEETRRTGSELAMRKYRDFKFFDGFEDNISLQKDYQIMQKNYVFKAEDTLPFEFIISQMKVLATKLKELD